MSGLIWLGGAVPSFAQREIRQGEGEPGYLFELNRRASRLTNTYPDSVYIISEKIKAEADPETMPFVMAEMHHAVGLAKMGEGKWTGAENAFREAIHFFRKTDDSLSVASSFDLLGYAVKGQGFLERHLEYQLLALDLRERFGADQKWIARSNGAIGTVYLELGDFGQAMSNFQKSLDIRRSISGLPPQAFGFSLRNIGRVYFRQKEYDEAARYFEMAVDSFRANQNHKFVMNTQQLLGQLFFEKGELAEAEKYLDEAREISERLGGVAFRGWIYFDLAKLYIAQGKNKKAMAALEKAIGLFEASNARPGLRDAYRELSFLYEKKGDEANALRWFKAFDAMEDTLTTEKSSRRLDELRTQYDMGEKERQILLLQAEQAEDRALLMLLILGLGMAIVAALLIWRSNKKRKKAFAELVAEKERTDQLYQNLQAAQAQLVHAEKMASLGELTAGIAHEINNPLNFVATNAHALRLDLEDIGKLLAEVQLLQNDPSPERIKKVLEKMGELDPEFLRSETQQLIQSIERGAERTENIVSGLRIFSRKSSDDAFAPADLHEGLESTLTILGTKLKGRIIVHRDYADLPPVPCQFDRMNQVFMNILNNAIQAIEGEGEIFIRTSKEKDRVEISIRDTGRGMDDPTRQRIFEPFFTTKDVGEGTGLGLSISFGILEQHDGNIEVKSAEGKGTEFVVSLPINQHPDS